MKKCNYFNRIGVAQMATLAITLPFQMLPIAEGATQPEDIEVSDISCLCVRFAGVGETGIGKPIGTSGATRYELDGSAITVHVAPIAEKGEAAIIIEGKYGQVKLYAKIVLNVGAGTETITTVSPYVFSAIAAGGGSMEQYRLTLDGDHFVDPKGNPMTFEDVKAAVLDPGKFVFLDFANAYHIPCFVVDTEGNEAVGFTSTFSIAGAPHIERVAINQQDDINVYNYELLSTESEWYGTQEEYDDLEEYDPKVTYYIYEEE